MDIKDRIILIIEAEQLTSSKFADVVGIQRSSISHILSGRNNPSLEIIQKILTTFGTLNSEWLLFGRGQMYKNQQDRKLFEQESSAVKELDDKKPIEIQPNPTLNLKTDEPTEKIIQPEIQHDSFLNDSKNNNTIINPKTEQINKSVSKTEKIIIFNSDRTFTEYFPN